MWSLTERLAYEREEHRCECGAWTKQIWFLGDDGPNDWHDEWVCKNPRHIKETR